MRTDEGQRSPADRRGSAGAPTPEGGGAIRDPIAQFLHDIGSPGFPSPQEEKESDEPD